ncbi:MAG: D-2-hydroxyacid dehydrogenase [Mycobacterium sp.]
MSGKRIVVAIATPLDTGLVARIRAIDERLDVRYQPDLLPPLRFPGDHRGVESFRRTQQQEKRWRAMIAEAEVLFGLPGDSATGLAEAVRAGERLRWVQATAGGAGEQVQPADLSAAELDRVMITRAVGVHAGPLAEFAILGVLAFTKDLPRLLAGKQARRWDHYPVAELAGTTMLVLGLGSVGTEVARMAKALGMRVIAVNRTGRSDSPDVDEVRPPRFLADLLPVAHSVVVTLPLTEQTRGMIDAAAIERMHSGAVLVNVGRGGVIDEAALIEALEQGRLAGAALDVFATEPLSPDSALWTLPNVLLSPHTTGLSVHENERIVTLFSENLRRYLTGADLLGRVLPTT